MDCQVNIFHCVVDKKISNFSILSIEQKLFSHSDSLNCIEEKIDASLKDWKSLGGEDRQHLARYLRQLSFAIADTKKVTPAAVIIQSMP